MEKYLQGALRGLRVQWLEGSAASAAVGIQFISVCSNKWPACCYCCCCCSCCWPTAIKSNYQTSIDFQLLMKTSDSNSCERNETSAWHLATMNQNKGNQRWKKCVLKAHKKSLQGSFAPVEVGRSKRLHMLHNKVAYWWIVKLY